MTVFTRMKNSIAPVAVFAMLSTPAWAQGSSEGALEAGSFRLDPTHASVMYQVNHLGFSNFVGMFDEIAGTLSFDPNNPEASNLAVTVKAASVDSNDEAANNHLDDALVGAAMFDAENYPDITFVSTKIETTGDTTGKITGNLTIKDVTKPVTLDTALVGAGVNPFNQAYTMGFSAETVIKRSEFGLVEWIPGIGDDVTLRIQAEFNRIEEQE